MRVLLAALLVCVAIPVGAQTRDQTLADIRQELTVMSVEIRDLQRQLSTTGAPQAQNLPSNILDRVNAIEAELTRLTAQTEAMSLRVDRIVTDGTTRIGDLEFRLVELEGGDLSKLSMGTTLGGDTVAAPPRSAPQTTGPQLALSEQSDFDRAKALFDADQNAEAVAALTAYTQTYPGGALSGEAHYLRGEAEGRQGAWAKAARAYLDSFSGDPSGNRAPDALYKLGVSLEQLGQRDEACLTLSEVGVRFPGTGAAGSASTARSELACP